MSPQSKLRKRKSSVVWSLSSTSVAFILSLTYLASPTFFKVPYLFLHRCDTVLGEFLRSIKQDPSRANFPEMINILIVHAQAQDEFLQLTAITWIKEFVQLSGRNMLPFASGILTAILPCLSYDTDSRKSILALSDHSKSLIYSFKYCASATIFDNVNFLQRRQI